MGRIYRNGIPYGDGGTSLIADYYSSDSTYAVGDIVIYQGKLYECNTAIATPEAFNSTKWDVTNVAEELEDKIDASSVDASPTQNSTNPVQSGGVFTALAAKADLATSAKTFKKADVYSSSATYAVGDTCVESGILYICKVPISAAEAFDSSKWDAVTNTAGLFYIQPITTAAHTALLVKDPYTYYMIF